MITAKWDQSRFDAILKAKLSELSNEKIPNALNKTAFFLAKKAREETPKKMPFEIESDVMKKVTAVNSEGETAEVPILYILAAKANKGGYAEAKMMRGIKNKRATSAGKFYLKQLTKKAKSILGSRKRASGFLKVGWSSVLKQLAPMIKGKGGVSYSWGRDERIIGQMKGSVSPASAGNLAATITNSATAKSDRVNGLIKFGQPALDRAAAWSANDMLEHLKEETKETLNGII